MELLSKVLQAILEAALPILVSALAVWVIGKAREIFKKLRDKNPELYEILRAVCERAVTAAEQVYREGHGAEKKQYAINVVEEYLAAKGINLNLDVIEAYIEAAVLDMNINIWHMNMDAAARGYITAPTNNHQAAPGMEGEAK